MFTPGMCRLLCMSTSPLIETLARIMRSSVALDDGVAPVLLSLLQSAVCRATCPDADPAAENLSSGSVVSSVKQSTKRGDGLPFLLFALTHNETVVGLLDLSNAVIAVRASFCVGVIVFLFFF